jgi:NAD(P)-dependent dehydrogenase (short-subunit alcohol dehydrogenase family)
MRQTSTFPTRPPSSPARPQASASPRGSPRLARSRGQRPQPGRRRSHHHAPKQAVSGAAVPGVAADLGTAEGCAACCRRAIHRYLVNNAGVLGPQDFFEIPDSEWTRFFEINVMSGVRRSRAYLPGMIERNWGRVVFLSSESVKPLASPSPRVIAPMPIPRRRAPRLHQPRRRPRCEAP